MSELLAGIRVLESAVLFNGDTLGAHLADLGADVIKIESPRGGDYLRHFLGQITPGNSPAHVQVNRGKRSIALDLRTDQGREVFWRLLDTADVFVDGNAADACDKLGIGYAAQSVRKPDIVYCQYSGYGSEGPYAAIPTHGQMMDALAGACPHRMGDDGLMRPAEHVGPMRGMDTGGEGTAAGAIHAAFHVAAALVQRERTGRGAYIDVSGTDGVIGQAWIAASYALNEDRIADGRTMPRATSQGLTGAKYQFYETSDGHAVLFCCIEPKFWENFCRAVDREDLLDRHEREDLRREVQKIMHGRTLAEWTALAAELDIALGPAPRSVLEAAADPHVRGRGVIHTQDHPKVGEFTYIGEVGRVAGQPYSVRRPAPDLGEHTDEILAELGLAP
jgi:crotonobetainyl-CoA:carnitine CoA-transferase CaiB-like acyl-CoA transferase